MLVNIRALSYGALLGLSCAAPGAYAQNADVVHWLTSGGESKAIGVLANEYKKRGGTWIDNAMVGSESARSVATSRIAGGNPPTAMFWPLGGRMSGLTEQDLLVTMDDLAKSGNWNANLPILVNQKKQFNGHVIATPVGIHGVSWMFYNTKIFSDLKLEPPKTWDEFFVVADKIKSAGYIPLAHGGQPWQGAILFLNVMAGVGGKDFYRKVMIGNDAKLAGGETMLRIFDVYRRLTKYVDPASPNRKWNDTSVLIQKNKAAMQIMGDWAKGEFTAANLVLGKHYGCVMSPGNADAYIVTVDSFVYPKGSNKPDAVEAQRKLATVIMDPAVQLEYSRNKGSIPARLDVNVSSLDACAQLGRKIMASDANQLPNNALAFSPDVEGQINDLLTKFWNAPAMTSAQAAKQYADIIASAKH